MMRSRSWLPLLVASALLALLVVGPARAGEATFVALESSVAGVGQGDALFSHSELALPFGAQLTVVGPDGRMIVIAGPFTGTLSDAIAQVGRADAATLGGLTVGATRGAAPGSWSVGRIALTVGIAESAPTVRAAVEARIEVARERIAHHFDLVLVRASESAETPEVWVEQRERALWVSHGHRLAPPPSHAEMVVSFPLTGQPAQEGAILAAVLERFALASRVIALAEGATESLPLRVAFTARRAAGSEHSFAPDELVELASGDELVLRISNDGSTPVDATVFLVDGHARVLPLFPYTRGDANRIGPGRGEVVTGEIDASETAGLEHVVVVAREARGDEPAIDLSPLASASFSGAPLPALEGDASAEAWSLLARAGFQCDGPRQWGRVAVRRFSWITVPDRPAAAD